MIETNFLPLSQTGKTEPPWVVATSPFCYRTESDGNIFRKLALTRTPDPIQPTYGSKAGSYGLFAAVICRSARRSVWSTRFHNPIYTGNVLLSQNERSAYNEDVTAFLVVSRDDFKPVRRCGVNIFKTLRLRHRSADVDETWHVHPVCPGEKLSEAAF